MIPFSYRSLLRAVVLAVLSFKLVHKLLVMEFRISVRPEVALLLLSVDPPAPVLQIPRQCRTYLDLHFRRTLKIHSTCPFTD
jgi:hypothetical protein